jgi:hypothetical protein
MNVQITIARNEFHLIKELLPIWKKYADGFVFLLHNSTDETESYLESVAGEFNILKVLKVDDGDMCPIETDKRQLLFDEARKYTNKIICLDADEYLDGSMSKDELSDMLEINPDTTFHLNWIQYTSINTVRVDGPWQVNFKDRIGNFTNSSKFVTTQMHSTHLPTTPTNKLVDRDKLFIAHLHWLNKTYAAIKQYYWKVEDYINNKNFGINTVGNQAYDNSVNNFEWEEEYTSDLLKVSPWVIDEITLNSNYRIPILKSRIKQYNIPDLGSWGYDFLNIENTNFDLNRYKISVITAIGDLKKYEKFISRWISNVKDQYFFKQTEHIIVYKEWSKYFEDIKNLDNFKLINEGESNGMYYAWNIGIHNSTTKYITNWNVDDLRHPINNKIKFDLLERNKDIDMVYNWYIATKDGNEDFYNIDISNKSIIEYPDNFHNVVLENCYAGPDPMWRKLLHDSVGYFDYENFSIIGDWDMWIRFAKNGFKFKLIPAALCIYLDHDDTVSKSNSDLINYQKHKIYERHFK